MEILIKSGIPFFLSFGITWGICVAIVLKLQKRKNQKRHITRPVTFSEGRFIYGVDPAEAGKDITIKHKK